MKLQTRRRRQLRENVKRAFIWAFLAVFIVSCVGVLLVSVNAR